VAHRRAAAAAADALHLGRGRAAHLLRHAGRLEAAIKERQSLGQLDRLIDALAEPLVQLTAELARMLGNLPEPVTEPAITIDPVELTRAVDRLIALLAANDPEATDVLAENAGLLKAGFPADYRNLEDYIRNFDFEEALVVLKAAAAAQPLLP